MMCLKPVVAIKIQTGTSSECESSSFFNAKGLRLWIAVGRSYGTFWDCPFWGGAKKLLYVSEWPLSSYPPGVASSMFHRQSIRTLATKRIIWKY